MAVFATRYLDLFTNFHSIYNSLMKVLYLSSTAVIIYMIKVVEPTKSTYSSSQDEFNIWKYAIVPSIVLAFILAFDLDYFDGLKLLWTYSIIQEVTAMIPQLVIAHYNRHIQSEIKLAILFRGVYRFFYIINYIYRAHTEVNYKHNWIVYICAVMQIAIYGDFFYHTATYVLIVDCLQICQFLLPLLNRFLSHYSRTIYSNCRADGNELPHIALDGNELLDPLIFIEQNTETEVSVMPSSLDAATVPDEKFKDNADPVEEIKSIHDTPSVHLV